MPRSEAILFHFGTEGDHLAYHCFPVNFCYCYACFRSSHGILNPRGSVHKQAPYEVDCKSFQECTCRDALPCEYFELNSFFPIFCVNNINQQLLYDRW